MKVNLVVCNGKCSASDRKVLQRVVPTAQYVTWAKLPAIQDLQWLAKIFTPPYFVALQPGIKMDFGGFVSFDLHNMHTTLTIEILFYCKTNKKRRQKN